MQNCDQNATNFLDAGVEPVSYALNLIITECCDSPHFFCTKLKGIKSLHLYLISFPNPSFFHLVVESIHKNYHWHAIKYSLRDLSSNSELSHLLVKIPMRIRWGLSRFCRHQVRVEFLLFTGLAKKIIAS